MARRIFVIEEAYWAQFGPLLDVEDLQRILRRSRLAVYGWLREGLVPGHRLGTRWVVFAESIAAFLEDPKAPFALPAKYLAGWSDELSPEDLANMLGISTKTVYKLLSAEVLPGRRVSSYWVIYKSEVLQMLRETSNWKPPAAD